MLSGLYNNNYEFHLTSDHLVILVEMVHDARIIPIYASADAARASHTPAVITPWLGDSVAWWEGDTLVVDSIAFNDQTWLDKGGYFTSDRKRVIERFNAHCHLGGHARAQARGRLEHGDCRGIFLDV